MKAKTCNDIFEKAIDCYHINNEIDSSYPNPFEKYVMVSAENPISSLRLMDMFGRVVYEYKDINQLIVRIDLDILKGLYILEIRSENEWYKIPITRE